MKSTEKQPDRRIEKTRKLLSDALVALIMEKGYEAVTVQDILDKANVGRSTFYAHYESKEQLLLHGHENFNKLLTSEHNRPENAEGVYVDLLSLYRHTAENLKLAKALLGKKGGDVVFSRIRDMVYHRIMKHYLPVKQYAKADRFRLTAAARAAAFAVVSLLAQWLDENMPVPAEEMAEKSNGIINDVMGEMMGQ